MNVFIIYINAGLKAGKEKTCSKKIDYKSETSARKAVQKMYSSPILVLFVVDGTLQIPSNDFDFFENRTSIGAEVSGGVSVIIPKC